MMKKLNIDANIKVLSPPRVKEYKITTMEGLVQYYVSEIESVNTERMIFWGHSFGGNAAFEVIKRIQRVHKEKLKDLKCLLITSSYPPNRLHEINHFNSRAEEPELVQQLEQMSYVKHGFEMEQVKTMVLDKFKDDLMLLENYISDNEKVSGNHYPVYLIYGTDDIGVEDDYVSDWAKYIDNLVDSKMKGGHFFINQEQNIINIRSIIEKYFS